MSNADIKKAVKKCNFLPLLQPLHPSYRGLYPDSVAPDYTEDELRQVAIENDCLQQFERDLALVPSAISSRISIEAYSKRNGVRVETDDECNVWITRAKGKKEFKRLVCTPVIIAGEGYNHLGGGACLEILIRTTKGQWMPMFIPRHEIVAGKELQGRLQGSGLLPGKYIDLLHLLQNVDPPHKFVRLETAGWNGDHYVLPSGEVFPDDETAVSTFAGLPNFTVGGV